MSNLVIIGDVAISQDAEGRYCLNDLHKAAGGEMKYQPSNWLRGDDIKGLIDELINSSEMMSLPLTSILGRNGGTFACKELVYAYAMWISPKFHLHVIRAFDKLVTEGEQAAEEFVKSKPKSEQFKEMVKINRLALALAQDYGFEGNQAFLSADKITRKLINESPLEYLGIELVAPSKSRYLTVTEIGKKLGVSARQVNVMLKDMSLQGEYRRTNGDKAWSMTEKGKEFGILIDSGKRDNQGTPIQQLKWYEDILPELRNYIADTKAEIKKKAKEIGLTVEVAA